MSTNAIIAALGKQPHSVISLGKEKDIWQFGVVPFPAPGATPGCLVYAVSLMITNGQLASWGYAFAGPERETQGRKPSNESKSAEGKSAPAAGGPALKLFVVSSKAVAGGHFIDTEQLPKLGFVAADPNMTINVLRRVTVEERSLPVEQEGRRTVWTFGIRLTEGDGRSLAALTATNLSKRILIMVSDTPVSAPIVRAPLQTGSFLIECSDPALAETVRSQLVKMAVSSSD
jgi:hypothetical protein